MAFTLEDKLVVAISSRALFDFEEENGVYEAGDLREYEALQRSRLHVPAKPGIAFSLIEKLLALNVDGERRNTCPSRVGRGWPSFRSRIRSLSNPGGRSYPN